MAALLDPFGRSRLPVDRLDRVERVRLLQEAADALLEGSPVPRDAALFLGGGIAAWLAEGGSLDRDYLRVRAPQGSHDTPKQLAVQLRDDDDEERTPHRR